MDFAILGPLRVVDGDADIELGGPRQQRVLACLLAVHPEELSADQLVYESGAYDPETGDLSHDADAKIYEIKPGLDEVTAPIAGVDPGPSFHFVLNNAVFKDNRIPPRGFSHAAFEAIQSPPVAYAYADGQYWDDTVYDLPAEGLSGAVPIQRAALDNVALCEALGYPAEGDSGTASAPKKE